MSQRGNRVKKEPQKVREVRAKYVEQAQETMPVLVPKTTKQKKYMDYISKYDTVFATGFAGTSKTYVPVSMAAEAYKKGQINKIILVRPNISNSESLGMFKGTLIEKMTPWLRPVLGVLRKYMNMAEIECALKNENIEFVPMETIKGNSFSDAFIICDEAEDLTVEEMKKILTRQGENSKLILAGDITQSELKGDSGLLKAIQMVERHKNVHAAHVDFNELSDIVRSKATRAWVEAFHKEGI